MLCLSTPYHSCQKKIFYNSCCHTGVWAFTEKEWVPHKLVGFTLRHCTMLLLPITLFLFYYTNLFPLCTITESHFTYNSHSLYCLTCCLPFLELPPTLLQQGGYKSIIFNKKIRFYLIILFKNKPFQIKLKNMSIYITQTYTYIYYYIY